MTFIYIPSMQICVKEDYFLLNAIKYANMHSYTLECMSVPTETKQEILSKHLLLLTPKKCINSFYPIKLSMYIRKISNLLYIYVYIYID